MFSREKSVLALLSDSYSKLEVISISVMGPLLILPYTIYWLLKLLTTTLEKV